MIEAHQCPRHHDRFAGEKAAPLHPQELLVGIEPVRLAARDAAEIENRCRRERKLARAAGDPVHGQALGDRNLGGLHRR